MSPNTLDDFEISMRLRLEGIGAVLREENGHTIVVEVVPGGAAAKDGRLKANDKIIAVAQGDGKFVDVVDMKLRDAVKLIRGPKGTKVELKVVPAGKLEPVVYALTRAADRDRSRRPPATRSSRTARRPTASRTASASSICRRSTPAREPAIRRGQERQQGRAPHPERPQGAGVDGVVLDMRGNPGGFLNEAIALAGLFIDQGPVVQVKGAAPGRHARMDDPEKGVVYGGPLMVLVSRSSASAVGNRRRRPCKTMAGPSIVGDSATHGKGTVQAVIDLGDQLPQARPPSSAPCA